jgi:3-oxoadipate enol-lactonase
MPTAHLGSIDVYYERAGAGDPLLFISGTGGDLRVKPNIFDSPLARDFDLLAYDQRGLGRTSKPDIAYTMADYADDAAAPRQQHPHRFPAGRRRREGRTASL